MSLTLAKPNMMDLLYLCHRARPDEREQWEALTGREWQTDDVAIDLHSREGVGIVLLDGERPVCAGGYSPVINHVWESWMVGTMDDWDKHWRTITKVSRRLMNQLLAGDVLRLQTAVLATRTKTCEWYVRGLKMKFEGRMHSMGANGEDMDIYARIRNG